MNNQISKSQHRPLLYVGVGASAGGLEAIESFFSNMPPNNGFAFIVIQHLSPDYKSLMVELLSKRTEMKVLRAEDGTEVEPDTIYLIPPKKNLTIFHGKILLHDPDPEKHLNLPIDIFLQSLADDQGEKSVGIILSGTGSDGMRGVRAIKEAGGMVMVQEESSAKFDGMPRSAISTGLTDFILSPEKMPQQLLAFAQFPYATKANYLAQLTQSENELDRIFAILREKSKLDFKYYKPTTVTRRIERRMTVNQIDDLQEYVNFLESYPGEVKNLYNELLIGVTSFFRDIEAYKKLREKWLPEIFKANTTGDIRFWVAGCSTGEEAYSLAMTARHVLDEMDKRINVKIFATDVDNDSIMRAGTGIYPESNTADLPDGYFTKFFHRDRENIRISREIREMVVFAQHNLVKDPPFTNIDFISCRNLLIYLQPVLQRKVLEYFNFSLKPNGILFLGSSETTGEMSEHFEILDTKWKIYRHLGRKNMAGLSPQMVQMNNLTIPAGGSYYAGDKLRTRITEESKVLSRFLKSISNDYLPPTIIINEDMEVVHNVGAVSKYLHIPEGQMKNNILKMVGKELAIPLATGINKAIDQKHEIKYSNIKYNVQDRRVNLNVRIKPIQGRKNETELLSIFIEEKEKAPAADEENLETYDIDKEAEQRISDLEQELQFSRENLQATIEELETSNEELQATNEELLASNEELQSTNEELQSVNEELHTVNAEHQMKILELTELNNDLDNLLAGTDIATLFIDENLDVRKFTPRVTEILHIKEKHIDQPFRGIETKLEDVDLIWKVKEVHEQHEPIEKDVRTEDGNWYLMRILPYNVAPNVYSGVLITFTEISQLKEAEEKIKKRESELSAVTEVLKAGRWEYNPNLGEVEIGEEVRNMLDIDAEEQLSVEGFAKVFHGASKSRFLKDIEKAIEKETEFNNEYLLKRGKKDESWVRVIGRVNKTNGSVNSIWGVIYDITDVKLTKKQLGKTEQIYRNISDTMTNAVVICEFKNKKTGFTVKELNKAAESLLNLEKSDVVDSPLKSIFSKAKDNGLQEILENVLETGETYSGENFKYNDSKYKLELNLLVYKIGSGELFLILDEV